ncbi:MAG: hypothetical protein AB7O62_17925 [Pirellulales bacterium]
MSRVINTSTITNIFGNSQGCFVVARRDERVDHARPCHFANPACYLADRAAFMASSITAGTTGPLADRRDKSSRLTGRKMQGWHLSRPEPRRFLAFA